MGRRTRLGGNLPQAWETPERPPERRCRAVPTPFLSTSAAGETLNDVHIPPAAQVLNQWAGATVEWGTLCR